MIDGLIELAMAGPDLDDTGRDHSLMGCVGRLVDTYKAVCKLDGTRAEMIEVIRKDSSRFGDAPDWLRDDDEVAAMAVDNAPVELQFASDRLRGDRRFVEYALSTPVKGHGLSWSGLRPDIFRYASSELRDDADMAFLAMSYDPGCISSVSRRLRENTDWLIRVSRFSYSSLLLDVPLEVTTTEAFWARLLVADWHVFIKDAPDWVKGNDRLMALEARGRIAGLLRRWRWPHLLRSMLRFARHDREYRESFLPSRVASLAFDDGSGFMEGGDEVGPRASAYWEAVMTRRERNRQQGGNVVS